MSGALPNEATSYQNKMVLIRNYHLFSKISEEEYESLNIVHHFLEAKKGGNLFIERSVGHAHLHPCPRCGQPTSTPDFCSFCRMIEKAQTEAAE